MLMNCTRTTCYVLRNAIEITNYSSWTFVLKVILTSCKVLNNYQEPCCEHWWTKIFVPHDTPTYILHVSFNDKNAVRTQDGDFNDETSMVFPPQICIV